MLSFDSVPIPQSCSLKAALLSTTALSEHLLKLVSLQIVTCSGFLLIRILNTLLKKLASRGFRGDSFKRKLYSFRSKDSSSPNLSLICETSDVSSSHDMFGYLGKEKIIHHSYFGVLILTALNSESSNASD